MLFNLFNKSKTNSDEERKAVVEANRKKLINDSTSFDVRESYKELRTNIMFSLTGEGCKKVLLTSSVASEGKSTTNLNLTITFGEMGAKVILIDCDLRRPNVARLLNEKGDRGLSNILVNDCTVKSAIFKTKYQNLDVIFAGKIPPNPAELLSSDRMRSLVEELSKEYDYIFFDTPPINLVTDAALISSLTDGVVLVSRQFVTERRLLAQAVEKLKFVQAKIIGVVLNDVTSNKVGYGGYKKYGYYKRSYGYGYYTSKEEAE
jgi:capsular exopolysaccharide synthesis family protein